MDDPRLTATPPRPTTAAPAPAAPVTIRRQVLLPWLLLAAALGVIGWQVFKPAKLGDPLATSLVAFEKQNRLTVFSAELAPVVSSEDSRYLGILKTRQVAVVPARVDFTIDLSAMDRNRLKWDQEKRRLDVVLPPLQLSRPNLDEARAQYLRAGVFITREAQDKLNRNTTQLAEQQATRNAANPVLMGLARSAAKDAIRQNLAIPLQVAGYGDVTVTVRFDGEPVPAQ